MLQTMETPVVGEVEMNSVILFSGPEKVRGRSVRNPILNGGGDSSGRGGRTDPESNKKRPGVRYST